MDTDTECESCEGTGWLYEACSTPWCSDRSHDAWHACPECNPDGEER